MGRGLVPAVALALTLSAAVRAAEPCTIRGDARDLQGKPISAATVILDPANGKKVDTSEDGSFVFADLKPGQYAVVILASGFRPWAASEVHLDAAEAATLHAVMEIEPEPTVVYYEEPTERDLAVYGDVLTATGESPLCSPTRVQPGVEAYRFVWLRTFHHPVVVELRFNTATDIVAVYKETDGAGGYEVGRLSKKTMRSVRKDYLDDIKDSEMATDALTMLRDEGFAELWKLPFRVEAIDNMVHLDGATWTIEGIKDSRCHVVTRWGPPDGDPVRTMGLRLIGMTREKLLFDEVY